jgi:hypothetical protein
MLLLGFAAMAAVAPPAHAAEPRVIDDWRSIGPPEVGANPGAKGILSPAAAERLVRAIDEAWSSGRPLRARGDTLEWIVDNLRLVFLRPDTQQVPGMLGSREDVRRNWDHVHRIDVLGGRVVGGHQMLLVIAHVAWNIYTDVYDPTVLAVALRPDGRVTDVIPLTYGFGDACGAEHRAFRVEDEGLRVEHEWQGEGVLCVFAPPIPLPITSPPEDECCAVREGDTTLLDLGGDGRFQTKRQTRLSLSGQFVDSRTDEEILVEDGLRWPVRLGYRSKPKAPWKELRFVSRDPKSGVIVARFVNSKVDYTLTMAADGKSLTSVGSDGSKPQRFDWIPLRTRWSRSPDR